jgi:hypothetical protein
MEMMMADAIRLGVTSTPLPCKMENGKTKAK